MKTFTATKIRKDLFNVFSNIVKKHEIYNINYKENGIIMLNQNDYEDLVETIELLSEPNFKNKLKQAEKEIKNKETFTFDEIFK
jgi:antitoxin YefM